MASRRFFTVLNNKIKIFTENIILPRTRTYCFTPDPVRRNHLFARISAAGSPSCSVAAVLQQWVEEGKNVDKWVVQRIVHYLRGRRRYSKALEICEWMSSSDLKLSSSDRAVQLDLIGRIRGITSAKSFFSSLRDEDKTFKTYGALLSCYVREGLTDESLSLMKTMRDMGMRPSSLNYINIMWLYTNTGQHEKVPDVLLEMKRNGISPNKFCYRVCINSYGARADYKSMEKVLQEMNSQKLVQIDWATYSVVTNYYIKASLKEKAVYYLKKCEEVVGRDAVGFNHLISHYASLGNKDEMKRLWDLQKVRCGKQINRDYITMLGSLVKLGELEETEKLLEEWELSCITYDFRVPNILLIGYCQNGSVEKAETKLKDIIKRTKTAAPNSWSIITAGYVNSNKKKKGFECFKEALAVHEQNRDWRPRESLISSILSWLGENGTVEDAETFVELLRAKVSTNREMYHTLLKAYIREGKQVEGLLQRMKDDQIDEDEETMKILSHM